MQKLLNNVADVIPHWAEVVYIVPPCGKKVIMSNIIYMPITFPAHSQGHLAMVIDWTPTT